MARLLYDTDVLIDHLQGTRTLPVGDDLAYSCVSRAELYSWPLPTRTESMPSSTR